MAILKRTTISRRTVDRLKADKDTVFWDSELLGFGVRVYPTGRKVYVVQTRAGGRNGTRRSAATESSCPRKRANPLTRRIFANQRPVADAVPQAVIPQKPQPNLRARWLRMSERRDQSVFELHRIAIRQGRRIHVTAPRPKMHHGLDGTLSP